MLDHLGRPRFLGKLILDGKQEALLTPEQADILQEQIQKNRERVDQYVALIDRLVNIEGFSPTHDRVESLRQRLFLLMEENNTFRKTLWHHWLLLEAPNLAY
jgi:hypothetical protein